MLYMCKSPMQDISSGPQCHMSIQAYADLQLITVKTVKYTAN